MELYFLPLPPDIFRARWTLLEKKATSSQSFQGYSPVCHPRAVTRQALGGEPQKKMGVKPQRQLREPGSTPNQPAQPEKPPIRANKCS